MRAIFGILLGYWFGGERGAIGAGVALCIVALSELLEDASVIAARPAVVTKCREPTPGRGAKPNYSMVPQSSLGIFNGLMIKLVYEYRILGTENCLTRFMQRSALALFNKKREKCPTDKIRDFALKAGISLDGWDRPIEKYISIDDFFTRAYAELDWGKPRPNAIVSPSEGTAVAFASVGLMQELWVKQKALTMANIGIPDEFLPEFQAGCTVSYLKLDVNNLHRFYAPVSGRIAARVDYLEPLRMSHSVRPFCLHAGWNILTENRRVLLLIDNDVFGTVLMMIVGGIAIDGIDMIVKDGEQVAQGQEVGCFHMGGSAILLAVPHMGKNGSRKAAGVKLREDLEVSSLLQNEFSVRVGDTLMTLNDQEANGSVKED